MALLNGFRCAVIVLASSTLLGLSFAATAGDKSDKKEAPKSGSKIVDEGAFGVIVRGQRVMTESFSIQQDNGNSVVKSHLQQAGSAGAVNQKSEMQMTAGGELIRYDWTDGSGSLTVTPKDEFLLEKISVSPSQKPAEQPFLMPNTSAILDNNFFIHREVLAWRYLATNCKNDGGNLKCQQGSVEFGVLVPQDRTSMPVKMEIAGREKISYHGIERDFLKLNLKGEAFTWAIWVDDKDQFKVVRVMIPDANTEVVRD